jgi:predicted dehydrogenase
MSTQPSDRAFRTASRTRRRFLAGSGALIAGLAAAGSSPAQATPNSLAIGLIGCGRRGRQLLEAALRVPGAAFPIVCDVSAERGAALADLAARLGSVRPAVTNDYRDVLENRSVQAVMIATPTHWHLVQFLTACAAEKHVYLETPLCMSAVDLKAMIYATRKYKRVVQAGLQYRSSRVFGEAAGLVRAGSLGRLAQTRTWNFTRQTPIPARPDGPPPADLDYDRWLGPAPERPFNPVRFQCPEHYWDYGGGEMAMWNCHLQDLVQAAVRVNVPASVVAVGGRGGLNDARETPDTLDTIFTYETPDGPFTQIYSLRLSNAYAGWGPAALPPAPRTGSALPARSGTQFFGADKTLYLQGERIVLLPAGEDSPAEDLAFLGVGASRPADPGEAGVDPVTVAHVRNFIECVWAGREPAASIEAAQWSTYACMIANIAYRLGRRIYISPDASELFSDPELKKPDQEAMAMTFRPNRAGYPVPNV